ncbi:MAG: TolC family protein [Bacteroidia bacterium]|nr:TolC family protein [Bacteroidia bacterium]
MKIVNCLFLLININIISSQTNLTIKIIDSLLIKNNLILLSKKYNIELNKALIKQYSLYDNPEILIEQNIYNSNNKKYFDFSNEGEYIFQVQQLIKTAGKRSKFINLQKINTEIAKTEFELLISELFFQLHTAYYKLYYNEKIYEILNNEINEFEPLIKSYEVQLEKGNVSLKDVFRLRSVYFNLQKSSQLIFNEINQLKKDLSVYTGLSMDLNYIIVMPYENILKIENVTINSLIDSSLKYRKDLDILKLNYDYAKQNYRYQKSLRFPDLQIGYTFDKAGNFIQNYSAININFQLPVFNQNQGFIKSSEFTMRQIEAELKQKESSIKNELVAAYKNLLKTNELIINTKKDFIIKFDHVKDGMSENFKKRYIQVYEYADFFESYINAVQDYYNLLAEYFCQIEYINFLTGTKSIKIYE